MGSIGANRGSASGNVIPEQYAQAAERTQQGLELASTLNTQEVIQLTKNAEELRNVSDEYLDAMKSNLSSAAFRGVRGAQTARNRVIDESNRRILASRTAEDERRRRLNRAANANLRGL